MRRELILHVASKEILSTLRDRRAIISNLLIPFLVLPIVIFGLPYFLGGLFQREAEAITVVGVKGLNDIPSELRSLLVAHNISLEEVADPFASVETDRYLAALAVPAGLAEALAGGERVTVEIFSKHGNMRSELAAGRLQSAVGAYREMLVAKRLAAAGLDPAVLEPVAVNNVDASLPAERAAGQLGWLIPFFIVIWMLAGAQMTAIDATAGEKERGTLEVLLVAPIRRLEVVLGKFLATTVFGLSAGLMAILGYLLSGTLLHRLLGERMGELMQVMGGTLNVSPGGIALLALTSVLTAALMAALLIGITMFARSFKEAQSYVAPLSIILIVPVIGLQFADFFALAAPIYLVPVLNALLVMDGVIRASATPLQLILTWGSSLIYTALLLGFAYRNFRREDVLFRT
jgi:sodium transport system permease protein